MTVTLSSFKGINNKADKNRQPIEYLRECVDFNIDNSGLLSQRDGYVLKISGEITSLWSDNNRCFAVVNGNLCEVSNDYQLSILSAGIGSVRLDFTECNGSYYFVGENANGVIKGNTVYPIGQKRVAYQPTLSTISGGDFLPGTYLVAVTSLDIDGMESGTTSPVSITITESGQALQLSSLYQTTDSRVAELAIYVSAQNGSELYRQGTVSIGTTSVTVYSVSIDNYALDSIGYSNAPYGGIIAYNYGHLFIANGKYLFYSDSFKYERWNNANYYAYETNITAVLPVENGLWIGTEDGIYWVSGKTPKHDKESPGDFTQVKKQNDIIKKGSAIWIDSQYVNDGSTGGAWVATTQNGLFLMNDQGQIINLTQDFINLPDFDSCAGVIVNDSDSFRYVAILKGAKVPERTI